MTKLEHEIIYRTVIGNRDVSINDIIIGCYNLANAQSVKWSVDKLIDLDILIYDKGVINTIKPNDYFFYRTVINEINVLTCTEMDKIIRSLITGRVPISKKMKLIAKIGTMVNMTINEMRFELRKPEFKLRFIKAGMRVIKNEIKEEYER